MHAPSPATLEPVDYFDGRSARAQPVSLRIDGETLVIRGDAVARREPVREVTWPERTRRGARIAHLAGGGSLVCGDGEAWDRWVLAHGRSDTWVVRVQQSWRWVLVALLGLVALLVLLEDRGIPWAAGAIVAATPQRVDSAVGEVTLEALDRDLLKPSGLAAGEQARLRAAFESALATLPRGTVPAHRLVFRSLPTGPNAFALPGGTIVLGDELVRLVDGDPDVIVGVLGHELGHLRHRDGMRMVVQAAALGLLASLVLGDVSSVVAAAPVILAQARYSRAAERAADAEAVRVLRASGRSPAVMVGFFERVGQWRRAGAPPLASPSASTPASRAAGPLPRASEAGVGQRRGAPGPGPRLPDDLGIAVASHPADAERIRYFEAAARHAAPFEPER
jgi:Zn-dependent protease with chaperone function